MVAVAAALAAAFGARETPRPSFYRGANPDAVTSMPAVRSATRIAGSGGSAGAMPAPGWPAALDVLRTANPTATEPAVLAALEQLRVWGHDAPAEALAAARTLDGALRTPAMIAVLEGAAAQPTVAVRVTRELLAEEPGTAADCGTALVGALIRAGAFGAALEFAQAGPEEQRPAWLATLLSAWAEREPAFAGELATLFGAQGIGGPAYQAIIDQWAKAAPADAVTFALMLPPGPSRDTALPTSLARWTTQNPAAIAELLGRLPTVRERDATAAALVCQTDEANRPTGLALNWAQGIQDAGLREKALVHVVKEWAARDAASAARFVAAADLSPDEHRALEQALNPPPRPEAF